MKHTPLPWKVAGTWKILVANCFQVKQEDAKFIVQACNSHNELVEICRQLIGIGLSKEAGTYKGHWIEDIDIVIGKAKQALSKAEEEK